MKNKGINTMKNYKSDRTWKDFDRAEKIMFFVMLGFWAALSCGIYNAAQNSKNIKPVSVVKTAAMQNVR